MTVLHSKQQGFGALSVVLVLVIIGIVGFTGWYVWNSKQAADATLSQTNAAADSTAVDSTKKSGTKASNKVDASVVEKRKFSTVSAELQSAILNYTKSTASDCVVNGAIVDMDKKPVDQEVDFAGAGSALTSVGCDGSVETLFVRRDSGNWEMVEKSQFGFSCDTLKLNKVPAKLLTLNGGEAQCNDGQSGLVAYKG